ncbi:MAG: hypothetical protein H5T61_04390 [Thermoflexales bacterium]|nr:hypothetical protein [Thermoflexales bacterium]
MIDLGSVAANALWVLGLALILAALSWANWRTHREPIRFREALRQPVSQRALNTGLALFAVGLAMTEHRLWAQVLWGLLAVLALLQAWWPRRI